MSEPLDPADIAITRGNNSPPARWQFLQSENPDVLADLTGSNFKLTASWPGGSIAKASDVNPTELSIDYLLSTLTWNYSTAQSRSLPLGRIARYEIEQWKGSGQQSLIAGYFVVDSGANPD